MSWLPCEASDCGREAILTLYGVRLCHTHHMATIAGLRRLGVFGVAGHRVAREEVLAALQPPSNQRRPVRSERELTAQQQQLLAQLALFPGGCTVPALEWVCQWPDAHAAQLHATLAGLVPRGLVRREDAQTGSRYALDETVRARFLEAGPQLDADGTLRSRQAAYYLGLAENSEPALWGPDVVATMDALNDEFENLSTAMRWAIQGGNAETALRLGAALWHFWDVRGRAARGLQWLEEAFDLPGQAPDLVKGRAFDAAGNLARSLGDYERATRFYVRTLQIWLQAGNRQSIALALNNLSISALYGGDQAGFEVHQSASSDVFRDLKDAAGLAVSLVTLGTMAYMQGKPGSARTLYEESLAMFKHLNNSRGVAGCLNNLANLVDEQGDPYTARDLYQRALTSYRALGDAAEEAACLKNLASLELGAGNLARAAELCSSSLALFDDLGDSRGILSCLTTLMRAAAQCGLLVEAMRVSGARDALASVLDVPDTETPAVTSLQQAAQDVLGSAQVAAAVSDGANMGLGAVAAAVAAAIERHVTLEYSEEIIMGQFLVERHLPGFKPEQLAGAAGAAKRASAELTAQGTSVRYLRSTFVPGQERCFCLFEGPSAEAVKQANDHAGLPFISITAAVHVASEDVA